MDRPAADLPCAGATVALHPEGVIGEQIEKQPAAAQERVSMLSNEHISVRLHSRFKAMRPPKLAQDVSTGSAP
jgi:hypothetical protein